MNELTKKMQEIMVPKAALIAYEYRESAYATGKNYLELRPINKAGRMEAGIPVTYEFMNALVESYSDGNRRIRTKDRMCPTVGCLPTCYGATPGKGMRNIYGTTRRENGGCSSRTA